MPLQLYTVLPQLQPYVKAICAMEVSEEEAQLSFRVLPDTCVELFINYKQAPLADIATNNLETFKNSIVTFRMSCYMDVRMLENSGCIAVCFYPVAAGRFFSASIANGIVALWDAWDVTGKELEERIALAKDNEERVSIIQQCLIKQLHQNRTIDKTVTYCLWQANLYKGQLTAGELADKAGLSQRQLRRKFNNAMGLSPKEYLRVSRFLHSLEVLKKDASHLTGVAFESGYYDQAHFIHEYNAFSGLTPGELKMTGNILY